MIEKTILDYLKDNDVNAYMERPSTEPAEYVLLEKTSSSTRDMVTTSTIAIQSYAKSLYEAASLNEHIKELMKEVDTLIGVSASKLVSDYNYTNTAAKRYRYQAVFEITHKE